ncbi:DUF2442 domain-containing protein [bacterium]|nr:DUF2442 domain-containing protein [bacterium]
MNTLIDKKIKAKKLSFNDEYLIVELEDARILQIPLIWYPRLYNATKKQLKHYKWIGKGSGIEWPELDEHLSVHGFLQGYH